MQKFRNAAQSDAAYCFESEKSAYDGGEAATLQKISTRIAGYPQGFLILEIDDIVVGFINSGCAYEVEMSDGDCDFNWSTQHFNLFGKKECLS